MHYLLERGKKYKRINGHTYVLFVATLLSINWLYSITIGTSNSANACQIQTDGNIVAAGSTIINGTDQFLISRYGTNGLLDANFGTAGIVTTLIGSDSIINTMALQSDGKIVVAGLASVAGQTQIALARYSALGVLDAANFGNGGIVTTSFGDGLTAYDCVIQPDGKIVLVGNVIISGVPQIILVRYLTNGNLDINFNSNGIVTTLYGVSSFGNAVALQSDGKIVVAGSSAGHVLLVRYNSADGSVDTSFGVNGFVQQSIGNLDSPRAILIDGSGNILVAGTTDSSGFMMRLNSSGVLDTSYGTNGLAINSNGSPVIFTDIALDANGKSVVVGSSNTNNLLIARYTSAGILDSTYGTSGMTIIAQSNATSANGVSLQSNGIAILAGYSCNDVILARLTTGGLLDTSFGNNGLVFNPTGQSCLVNPIGNNYLFCYDTTNQSAVVANTFIDISFNTNALSDGNWIHSASTAVFTCKQTGIYEVSYTAIVTVASGTSGQDCSIIGTLNGSEIFGSQASVDPALVLGVAPLTKSFLVSAKQDDFLKLRFAGQNNKVTLVANHALGIVRPSISISIVRVA